MGIKIKVRREENKERMNETPRRHQNSGQYVLCHWKDLNDRISKTP
jgi:hypothetical protein